VVLQLLELTRREDVSARQIADMLGQDPALAAKILRFANSPMAGIHRKVTSLQQAAALMGVRGVKMAALSFAVLGTSVKDACSGFNQKQFILQSVACGAAARLLALETKSDSAHEAFIAGLLSQIGRAVLSTAFPKEYAPVIAQARQIPRDLPPLESVVFGEHYASVSAQLLRSWGIPENLCFAIESFRDLDDGDEACPLARLLNVAEVAAGVICPDAKGGPPDSRAFVDAATSLLGVEAQRCADLINQIMAETENTRAVIQMRDGRTRSINDIQEEVRQRIAELSLAMHLEHEAMVQQQEDLMRRATTDALTGVGNRVAFDARLTLELDRFARSGEPLALMMIDVDRFKSFNDTYGHQAGDAVLRDVAHVLEANIRKVDYLARYGGEEFTVVAPETSAEMAGMVAERIRRAVEVHTVPWAGDRLGVTISVGVEIITETVDGTNASNIIRAADERLYAAKRGGRNRVELSQNGAPLKPVQA
jgi:diguanylate cyclase (GGDEF)-like protein